MLAYRKFAGGICVKVLEKSGFMVVCPVFLWKTGCQSDIIGHIVEKPRTSDGRNTDVKTETNYYSRFSVRGENDGDGATFYFL